MRIAGEDAPELTAPRDEAVGLLRRIADRLAAMEPAKAAESLTYFQHELEQLERRAATVLGIS